MYHTCNPTLLLSKLFSLVHQRSTHPPLRTGSSGGIWRRATSRVSLILDENVTQFQNPIYIFRRFNDGFVLENGGDEAMRQRSPSSKRLKRKQGRIPLESKKSEDRLIRVDRRKQERGEVSGCLWRVKIRTATQRVNPGLVRWVTDTYLALNSLILSWANPRT